MVISFIIIDYVSSLSSAAADRWVDPIERIHARVTRAFFVTMTACFLHQADQKSPNNKNELIRNLIARTDLAGGTGLSAKPVSSLIVRSTVQSVLPHSHGCLPIDRVPVRFFSYRSVGKQAQKVTAFI